MSDELIDVYDENMQQIGVMTRAQAHAEGSWHRSIHCMILRPLETGLVLWQYRSTKMCEFPNVLDVTVSGHYQAGEETGTVLQRELKEELNIDVTLADVRSLGITFDIARTPTLIHREFCDVFLLPREELLQQYTPCSDEVAGLVQFPIDDGLRLFAGEVDSIPAQCISRCKGADVWIAGERVIERDDFHPRVPPYYSSLLISARRFLDGERYLAV